VPGNNTHWRVCRCPGKGKGRVSVHLVNQTEKRVVAVKVGFDGFDAALDKLEFPETYASAVISAGLWRWYLQPNLRGLCSRTAATDPLYKIGSD
jgi:hypothetical protein